jgi:hypothetical protein
MSELSYVKNCMIKMRPDDKGPLFEQLPDRDDGAVYLRLDGIAEAFEDAGVSLNGTTILSAVENLLERES